ncbi:MAG: hypothetical protein HY644_05000 [Acidobacteria bacterium]|nr:hypothetical protein [Acidobacteriota bacterium]
MTHLLFVALLLAANIVESQNGTAIPAESPDTPPIGEVDITSSYVLGDVAQIDTTGKRLTATTKSGDVAILLDENTQYLRLAPGEKTLENAQVVTAAEISLGDRILARGKVAGDKKSVSARQLIVMSKVAIAQKQEREREEWRRRSIAGTITAINPAAKEITLLMRTREGPRSIVIAVGGNVVFRRYLPDSVRFTDTRPSSLNELKAGDHLRALGERVAQRTQFQPEVIVFGSFVMAGGPITSIDLTAGEMVINNIPTRKPLTVVINKDSTLRRIPPQMAAMLRQRSQAVAAAAQFGPGQERPGGAGEHARVNALRLETGEDVQETLERLPAITIADLKPEDVILVSGTAGSSPGRITAILLASGVEAVLTPLQGMQRPGADASLGLPSDVLDLEIGLPPN